MWDKILNFGKVFGMWGGHENDDDEGKVDNDSLEKETRPFSTNNAVDVGTPIPLEQQCAQIRAELTQVKRLVQEIHAAIHSLLTSGNADEDEGDHVKHDEGGQDEGTTFNKNELLELEKRFLYQKYVSPTNHDQDDIARRLCLTDAQVKTWLENRQSEFESGMEKLRNHVEASAHKSVCVSAHALGLLKN